MNILKLLGKGSTQTGVALSKVAKRNFVVSRSTPDVRVRFIYINLHYRDKNESETIQSLITPTML